MACRAHFRPTPFRASVLVLALGLFAASVSLATGTTDEEFIRSLGEASEKSPVDRKRLGRIFFSLAATLDGGKSSVRLMQGKITVPESSRLAVVSLLRTRYGNYVGSLERFREDVTAWLDQPGSTLLLHKALNDSQRACWHLDLYDRLIETYVTEPADMISLLSSREACTKLRTIAFQPRVEAIVREALVERIYQRRHLSELEAELAESERFLKEMLEPGETD